MKLFIVESPTKARTIQRYLGKGYIVRATFGHIKDLPKDKLGVDEETLQANYVFLRGKKKLVEELKKLAKSAEEVYIGTDPDREGEAIAFFLYRELNTVNRKLKRAVFHEITPSALKKSVEEAGNINMNMVYSQFARRILDRLIGYKVSPYLWKAFKDRKLSAGRVQSPALRLIVEREREIENFKERRYYYVKALLEKDGHRFEALYDYRYENPSYAKDILERIKEGVFSVAFVEDREEKVPPPRPFITSSLQSEANRILGFSSERTQAIAQKLYEMGYITYPRTDSYRMSTHKAQEFMDYILNKFGEAYRGRLRKFREKPTSQGAHECIRPVSLKKANLKGEYQQLYDLVFRRTLASLMANMVVKRKEVTVEVSSPSLKGGLKLKAKGVKLEFDGWSRVYPAQITESSLPALEEGDILKLVGVEIEERKTQPPPRYTEGSLIKKLEKLGIGRPSTYSSIVKTLKMRKYVHSYKKVLKPYPVAFDIVDYLMEHFPLMMDYGFTARMEDTLDKIEQGKLDWKEAVKELLGKVLTDV